MSAIDQWASIAMRIRGFISACQLAATLREREQAGADAHFLAYQCAEIVNMIYALQGVSDTLPRAGKVALDRFATQHAKKIVFVEGHDSKRKDWTVRNAAVMFAAFEAEMAHALGDASARILRISERAFEHLKRSIAADEGVRARWLTAFKKNEPACEALGAVHLLGLGIWAFKVDGGTGRTDLVYQEPIAEAESLTRAVDGLVLTEWKIAKSDGAIKAKAEEARRQTKLYAAGELAGIELRSTRFIVIVTEKTTPVPDDVNEDEITFRHINVPVDPDTPSKTARRVTSTTGST